MKTEPSLFVYEAAEDDTSATKELTVDLAKIALMNKRAGGNYWLRMTGGDSLDVPAPAGVAIRTAWIAYQGKFDPNKAR